MIPCLAIFLLLAASSVPAGAPAAAYLIDHFTEFPEAMGNSQALHLATGGDGPDWMPLNPSTIKLNCSLTAYFFEKNTILA